MQETVRETGPDIEITGAALSHGTLGGSRRRGVPISDRLLFLVKQADYIVQFLVRTCVGHQSQLLGEGVRRISKPLSVDEARIEGITGIISIEIGKAAHAVCPFILRHALSRVVGTGR